MPPQFKGAAEPLSQAGLSEALNILGVTPAAIWSVIAVETSGCGFLPDRRPKILFEHHIFHRQTGGHFDAVAPDLSNPIAEHIVGPRTGDGIQCGRGRFC